MPKKKVLQKSSEEILNKHYKDNSYPTHFPNEQIAYKISKTVFPKAVYHTLFEFQQNQYLVLSVSKILQIL